MYDVDENLIFKALADNTRRKQLDLLRERPHTTTELCVYFPDMTRFGVMRHLQLLEKAGLIRIKRSGKYRWNYLNVTPLQMIYERWMKPYEFLWVNRALTIKQLSEHKGGGQMSELTSISIELEIQISKPHEKVWDTLINEIDRWWLPDFHALGDSTVILEAHAGGRLYEKTVSGSEGLWYTVTSVSPNQLLELAGHLRPAYGGPATSLLRLSVEGKDDQTVLIIHDSLFGAVNENTHNSIRSGWKQLFEEGLKKYIEKLED
jgi:DNA-binding transcriptional ArsR family regulator